MRVTGPTVRQSQVTNQENPVVAKMARQKVPEKANRPGAPVNVNQPRDTGLAIKKESYALLFYCWLKTI